LIERYSPARIRQIWSDRHRFELWLQIEVLAAEGWATLGRVPAEALDRIRAAQFDLDRVQEIEARVGHDVIAFLTSVGESVGQPEARHLHLGLTSSDVVDTAFALQLRESGEAILEDLGRLRQIAAEELEAAGVALFADSFAQLLTGVTAKTQALLLAEPA